MIVHEKEKGIKLDWI